MNIQPTVTVRSQLPLPLAHRGGPEPLKCKPTCDPGDIVATGRAAVLAIVALLALVASLHAMADSSPVNALLQRAESGDTQAQFELAAHYGRGDGVARDHQAMLDWLTRAAEGGHAEAQTFLATLLLDTATDADSRAAAIHWLEAAAENGHAIARIHLGVLAIDAGAEAEGFAHFRLAAESGEPDAQYALGLMYRNGEFVESDGFEAVHWFRMAALQGHSDAQKMLGGAYWNGEAVPSDPESAWFWLTLAAAENPDVARFLESVTGVIEDSRRSMIEADAQRWRPGDPGPSASVASGTIDMKILLFDEVDETRPDQPIPSRQEHWQIVDALAYRRATPQLDEHQAFIELRLAPVTIDREFARRWFPSHGLVGMLGLTLGIDRNGRLLHGLYSNGEGHVEVRVEAFDADLRVRPDSVTGTIRMKQDSAATAGVDYSVDVTFSVPLLDEPPVDDTTGTGD